MQESGMPRPRKVRLAFDQGDGLAEVFDVTASYQGYPKFGWQATVEAVGANGHPLPESEREKWPLTSFRTTFNDPYECIAAAVELLARTSDPAGNQKGR